jgi:uncharacterized protein YjbI with pentapeptide repeats
MFDGVSFRGAKFVNTRVEAGLFDCNFDDTLWIQRKRNRVYGGKTTLGDGIIDCTFRNAVFRPAAGLPGDPPPHYDAAKAAMSGVRLASETLTRCDFTGAEMYECYVHVVMDGGSLRDVIMDACFLDLLHLTRTEVDGLTVKNSAVTGVWLENVDLREVGDRTARQLYRYQTDYGSENKWPIKVLFEEGVIPEEEYERLRGIGSKGLDVHKPVSEMTPQELRDYMEYMEEQEAMSRGR